MTILCPGAADGDKGTVRTTEYTKRVKDDITVTNAATTCTSGIMSMNRLFEGKASFNQDISSWDVSSVIHTSNMFKGVATFNQGLSSWDVSSVTTMYGMFDGAAAFNQDISIWNVSMVISMTNMFHSAVAFNQDLSNWCVGSVLGGAAGDTLGAPPDNFATDAHSGFTVTRQPQWGEPCSP